VAVRKLGKKWILFEGVKIGFWMIEGDFCKVLLKWQAAIERGY